ncbi:bifunctional 2-polyprenyl-6-hydroxyphenol methylase/3-demethylubiquinol 3-O-methyltransferase UbiG [Pleurocapsa sp. PCC 7319]|uniref:class I SAM-dependent methyltransferase n=1 Tax=Pleurocapsa sp. PCC 7319 TaxID=118161 RepID=UPI00034CC1EB|nr:methyltransferase domain-containing protein [Pleurocapsa sp. PCC 7319]
MIDSNNPEINVDELMEKVREEVANRQENFRPSRTKPALSISALSNNLNSIEGLLENAESRSLLRTKLPAKYYKFPLAEKLEKYILKTFNLLFRDQREVNHNLTNAFKQSININRQLILEIENLRSQLNERLGAVENRIQTANERVEAVENRTQTANERVEAVENRTQTVDERLSIVNSQIQDLAKSYLQNNNYLKSDLIQQKRLITLFLEEARQRLPEPFAQEQLQTFVNEDEYALDAFNVAFEDQFRGSREDIFNRLKVYLPLIEEAKVGTQDTPILDVGCGRGEWIELLQVNGYTASGLDINKVMIEQCQALGLKVVEADVIAYLRGLSDNSLGAITGFHIIEHLPFAILMQLFTEVIRVLKPEGIVIFETPNPENVLVGSCSFYIDPSHRNPLPSVTTKFIAESVGLHDVSIMKLHAYPEKQRVNGSEVAERFNDFFYGAQDYAVIGYKK